MLPIRLEIQAFGPYVKRQIVDFKQFEEKRLFLIEGETGSGKTMLLDAMTYAMYGKSSGGQREDLESMRSRFASDDIDTIVDFTFQVKDKIYCFKRSVQVYTKRTKNKEKGIKVKSDAGEIKNGEFYPFFENPTLRKVEEKAEEIIGLTYNQFVQVMVLPQGKFERFLTSKSEDKQEILNTLFQMERWDLINEKLTEQLQKKRNEIEELKQQCQADLRILDEENIESGKEHLKEYQTTIENLKKSYDDLHNEFEKLQKILLEQLEHHRRKQEIFRLEEEYTKQYQNYEKMEILKEQVSRWKKLQPIYTIYIKLKDSKVRVEKRKEQYDNALQQKEKIQIKYETLEQKREESLRLDNQIKIIENELNDLQEQVVIYNQYQKMCQDLKKQDHKITKEKTILDTCEEKRINLLNKEKAVIQEKCIYDTYLKQHKDYKEKYQIYEIAKKRYENRQNIINQMKQQFHLCQQKEKEYYNLEQKLEKLQKKHDEMYQCFLENSAVQLAQELKEGEPCPVCGSIHHPQLAVLEKVNIDITQLKKLKQQLDQMKKDADQLHKVWEKELTSVELQKRQKEDVEKQIQELIHCEYQQEKFNEIQNEYKKVLDTEKQIEVIEEELQHIGIEKEKLHADIEQQTSIVNDLQQQWSIMKNEESHMLEKLPNLEESMIKKRYEDKRKEQKDLKEIYVKLNSEINQISVQHASAQMKYQTMKDELEKETNSYESIQKEYSTKQDELDTSMEELEILPSYEIVSKKEQEIQKYFINIEHLKKEISDKKYEIKNIEFMNLDELEKQKEEKKHILDEVQKQLIYTQNKFDTYNKTLKRTETIIEKITEDEPKYLHMQHFVKAMRGDNGIGIERYVLGILLDYITIQANQLLSYIHEGRYQIYRSDDSTGRTRKYGLELSIFDSYSMEMRNVVSLSGGEKFLVSLAMSLALSMVVQARNGGIRFDCLFIDEGFGSLDEHSIADALAILQTMTHGKGMIGIISHVEVLKENIEQGIKVMKSRKGSSLYLR